MEAHTQKNMGLITAAVLFVAGIYMLVLSPPFPIFAFFGYPLTILCLIYTFALFVKKLLIAKIVYQLFQFGGLIILLLFTLPAIAAYPKWFHGIRGIVDVAILLCVWLVYGCVVLLLRIGLRGLEQVVGNEMNVKTSEDNK